MAYCVVPNALENYAPRKGLEGPFNFSGRPLYYDPATDFYVEQSEMDLINLSLYKLLQK